MSEKKTGTCPECGRTGVVLLKDGTIRMHNDHRVPSLGPWGTRCKGWGSLPVEGSVR